MAHGEVRCVGSALRLKRMFGSGYRLHVLPEDVAVFTTKFAKKFPFAKLEERDAGNLQFSYASLLVTRCSEIRSVARADQAAMDRVLTFLEKQEGRLVKEWGVSLATLEEGTPYASLESY